MLRRGSRLPVLALVLVVVSASLLAGCGASTEKTYKGHNVSFHYPQGWERAKFEGQSAQNAGGVWTEAFKPPSSSRADIVFVTEYQTPVAITKQNLAAYSKDVTASVASVARQGGGSLLAGPTPVSMGGLPGYGFRISAKTIHGLNSESRILLVWKGKTEYFLNCQHLTSGKLGAKIERGCKTVIGSFKAS